MRRRPALWLLPLALCVGAATYLNLARLASLVAPAREREPPSAARQDQPPGRTPEGGLPKARDKYHVVVSVNGNIYTEWQVRVCYYHYLKMRRLHPDSAMGGFTRLLHSGEHDALESEIPTVVVAPLPVGMDQGFVVLNRPYAFVQWVRDHLPRLEEDYVLMSEPDHLLILPPPLWAEGRRAAGYHFTYMVPSTVEDALRPYIGSRPITHVVPTGNAPFMLHKDLLAEIVEEWYDISLRMKNDEACDKAFGWILDMYAFSVALTRATRGPVEVQLRPELMVQPPFDAALAYGSSPVHIIHFTYGVDFNASGEVVYGRGVSRYYHWDKRDHLRSYPPRGYPLPPANVQHPAVRRLLEELVDAFSNVHPWPWYGRQENTLPPYA